MDKGSTAAGRIAEYHDAAPLDLDTIEARAKGRLAEAAPESCGCYACVSANDTVALVARIRELEAASGAAVLATMLDIIDQYKPEAVSEETLQIVALKNLCGWTSATPMIDLRDAVTKLYDALPRTGPGQT